MGEAKARLFCKVGELAGASFSIADELVVGRHPDCSGTLDPVQMSNRHARIFFDREEGRYFLEDLDSLNGTEIDGESVEGLESLGHLHVITFARRFDFIFQDLERCANRHDNKGAAGLPAAGSLAAGSLGAGSSAGAIDIERTRIEKLPLPLPGVLEKLGRIANPGDSLASMETVEPGVEEKTSFQKVIPRLPSNLLLSTPDEGGGEEAVPKSVGETPAVHRFSKFESTIERPPGLWLRVFLAKGEEQVFPLPEGEHLIGRESAADIRPASQEISRRHARVTVRGKQVLVEDLGSRNHTFVNDQQTEGQVEVPFEVELRFGRVVTQVVDTTRANPDEDSEEVSP